MIRRKRVKNLNIIKCLSAFLCMITLLTVFCIESVKAEINESENEEMTALTAYVDMSSVSPLQLYFTEEDEKNHPDYYYAALAFDILKERISLDPMYENCKELIVTVNHPTAFNDVMHTSYEPQVKTGYLSLRSSESNKYYIIDQVTIHIQREAIAP